MAIGGTLLIIGIIVAVIWVFIELKRFRHKIWAVFLIILILFTYFGFMMSIKGKNIDLKSMDGIKTAGKLYFAWLTNAFKNTKIITTNVIKMDWRGDNSTVSSG